MSLISTRQIDGLRILASSELNQEMRSDLGQFMTPSSVADFMTDQFKNWSGDIKLLDPGAGIGSLTESFVRKSATEKLVKKIHISVFEIDKVLLGYLEDNLTKLKETSKQKLSHEVFSTDFIFEGAKCNNESYGFTHIILNPPYKKIPANSKHRSALKEIGIEAPNLYVAFLALSIHLAKDGAEIVAIIPRSFCNGLYFRPFREWLFRQVAINSIHVFESRKNAFKDDEVLQENVIIRLTKGQKQEQVKISESADSTFSDYRERYADFEEVVHKEDTEQYIRIPDLIALDTNFLSHTLEDLGINVSTGPIVDFRTKEYWALEDQSEIAPLLYPHHFNGGEIKWPREHKKPNAIFVNANTKKLLMPRGWYVLVKRFSSKEEPRRVVANVINPEVYPHEFYGFENHLNVLHVNKQGFSKDLACGLSVFLNTTMLDKYFRTFSGHTQVNATDLRTMRFPSPDTLTKFGQWAQTQDSLTQQAIDGFIGQYVQVEAGAKNHSVTRNS